LIIDLDELDFGELLEVLDERLGNGIKCAIGLATASKVNMRNTIGKGKFAIAGKTIEYQCKTLIALNIARTLEEFIQHCTDQVL